MNRDQIWALKRDIERFMRGTGLDPRPMSVMDTRPFGAAHPDEIVVERLLRRTLAVLEEL